VLFPSGLRVSRSLRRVVRRRTFTVTADVAFGDVLDGCAAPRTYGSETWITDEMAIAYGRLHRLGWAHSFEAWQDDELVGGLYGVAIGRVFLGASMFGRDSDASKSAFVSAVRYLASRGFELIDCQIAPAQLRSLGATDIPRERFLRMLDDWCGAPKRAAAWTRDFASWLRDAEREQTV